MSISAEPGVTSPGEWALRIPNGVEGIYDPFGTYTGNPVVSCVNGCNHDEQDLAQEAYLAWSTARPEAAARGRPNRNAWLRRHGRDRHLT